MPLKRENKKGNTSKDSPRKERAPSKTSIQIQRQNRDLKEEGERKGMEEEEEEIRGDLMSKKRGKEGGNHECIKDSSDE